MREPLGRIIGDDDDFFYWISNAWGCIAVLNAALESGLLDRLGEAPVGIDELAGALALPSDKLSRLIDFLAAHELVALDGDGRVRSCAATERMRHASAFIRNSKGSMMAGSQLYPGLRDGKTPFEVQFGQPVFDYFPQHPAEAERFGEFMAFMTRRIERFVFSQHAFAPFEVAVDVGGSHGGLLLRLLQEHPGRRGVLFDLPNVAESVREAVRTAPAGDRVEVVGGNFFEAVPEGDLYLVKMILHDWDDEACIAILRNIRRAMRPGGRIAIIEHVMPERPEPGEGLVMDLAMMVWSTGRERRLREFEALFAGAGLRLDRLTANPRGQSVIEAVEG